MNILLLNLNDSGGGAPKIARQLLEGYNASGHRAWMAVARKRSEDERILTIDNERCRGAFARGLRRAAAATLDPMVGRVRGAGRLRRFVFERISQPRRAFDLWRGRENFDFPATPHLLGLPPQPPHLLHGHTLHGDYFDLRRLPELSRRLPVVLTLHDAWLLSGHCAHSLGCDRWRSGCGLCPDLGLYPAVRRDATAANWKFKRDLYAAARLRIATPSRWLLNRVEQSMLAPAVQEARVIPNGIDLSVFASGDRLQARRSLGLPGDAQIVLFAAHDLRSNCFKDYPTLRAALVRLGQEPRARPLILVGLGEAGRGEKLGSAEIRLVPFVSDEREVAAYYQAADLYVHPARAETFPTVILEAMACGAPVVATAVGGIPEQVEDGATGFLVPPGDPAALAEAMLRLLRDPAMADAFGRRASELARRRYSVQTMTARYLEWFGQILAAP